MGNKEAKRRKAAAHPRSGRKWLYVAVGVGLLGLVISIWSFTAGGASSPGSGSPQGNTPVAPNASLPAWLARAPFATREAYAYAAEHPETTGYIPCYCGCGQHSGHRSSQECFIGNRTANGVTYDQHGANCAMCIDIALMTKKMLAQGKALTDVRQAVAAKYSSLGPATNTPPIPRS